MGFTKFVLKHPVTVLMAVLVLIVFGISSVLNATLEEMPDTDRPMLIVNARYEGTSAEDMDELVTQPIENTLGTLEGITSMTTRTSDGSSMIMLEYSYGQDMDEAYNELSKAMNSMRGLPGDMDSPSVMEMSMNAQANMQLNIYHASSESLYDYADQRIVPELEKLSSVADVSMRGGKSQYIRVLLKSDRMTQYGVSMNNITQAMTAANSTYPSGSVQSGSLELDASTSINATTLDDLLRVPINTSTGKIVYLEDIADISYQDQTMGGMSRYNGEETISISVTKQQSVSAIELSNDVKAAVSTLMAQDEDLTIEIARDDADSILSSLKDVGITMILAIVISMIVLFLFFGDIKASLIVGSSIPVSILVTLIVMTKIGFTINIISMSGLVLSVGMMVDNSIVTLESCFRAKERYPGSTIEDYGHAAVTGSHEVFRSILGSTLTTCVVFLPLIGLNGMAGQMFGSLGYVIVISMIASLFSAITIVPLTYYLFKPVEKDSAPLSGLMEAMEKRYRSFLPKCLSHRAVIMGASAVLAAIAIVMGLNMKTELMPSDNTGSLTVSIETRPGLLDDKADEIIRAAEAIVAADDNVESYSLRYMGSDGSVTATLKDSAIKKSDTIAADWENKMADIDNCTITVSADQRMNFGGGMGRGYNAIIQGTQYDELKEVSDSIVKQLIARDDVMNVHSSIENTAPVVSIEVDSVAASAANLTSSQIGSQVKAYLDGSKIATLTIDGNEIQVKAEYPEGEYDSVPQLERLLIQDGRGRNIALTDVANIVYKDSPASISKENKQYQVTISADYVGSNVSSTLDNEVVLPSLTGTITKGTNSMDRMMNEEFSGLYKAIAIAVFLVFVVLAAQFESLKFSLMVLLTIPFSLAGSFLLLGVSGVSMSMTSLIGFLILVGTVVNNGILYVDTVNHERADLERGLNESLIDAGAIRIRPILMTSLTTILSMIPMAMSFGNSGASTQGLAVVDIGGLSLGVLVALFILPVFYQLMNGRKELRRLKV